MSHTIHVGVVIVNYNSAHYLAKAIAAIQKQTYKPFEVIIFDNASTEAIPDSILTNELNIKIIKSAVNLGFAGGNNRAIEQLHPAVNWIALVNPDAYLAKDWLEMMVNAIQAYPQYQFLGSKLICELEPHLLDGTGDAYHLSGKAWRMNFKKPLSYAASTVQEIFSPCAAAALYQRAIFQQIGGFDEHFFCYYEDIDLAFRLRLLGYKCCYVPTACAFHTGSATTTRHSDFYTYYGHRNLVWTYLKNMPGSLLLLSLPLHILLNLISIIVIGNRGQIKIILKAKKDALKGFRSIIQQRRKLQKMRKISAKAIFKMMHKGLPW